jgi:uncharacterized protein (DUF2141 family)
MTSFSRMVTVWLWVGIGVGIAGAASAQSESNGDKLTVRIEQVRGDKGVVRCALFNKGKGFPDEADRSLTRAVGKISAGKAECVFPNIEAGVYAVSIYHDADNNDKLKANFLGVPKEGWAVSNNADPHTFGPPEFEDARFRYTGGAQFISVRLRY